MIFILKYVSIVRLIFKQRVNKIKPTNIYTKLLHISKWIYNAYRILFSHIKIRNKNNICVIVSDLKGFRVCFFFSFFKTI